MAISEFAPMPVQDPMVEAEYPELLDKKVYAALGRLLPTRVWIDWYTTINSRLDAAPTQAATPISLADQTDGIGLTPISMDVTQGMYRVSYYARVTTPATSSSSLIISIGFTDQGVPCTVQSPDLNVNSIAFPMEGDFFIYCDRQSLIEYMVTYGSVGTTAMIYKLVLTVEAVAPA